MIQLSDGIALPSGEAFDSCEDGLGGCCTSAEQIAYNLSVFNKPILLQQTKEAQEFVQSSITMQNLLPEIKEQLRGYFGSKPLMLELIHDPESHKESLLLSVMVDSDIDSASKALRRFEDEWWLDQNEMAHEILSIDVMPV